MKTGLRYRVRLLVAAVVSSVAIGSAGVAQAEIISADSSAYGANVDLGIGLSLTPLDSIVSAGVGPIPVVSGNAPASYNDAQSLASVNANGSISLLGLGPVDLIDFNTGVLDVNAQSNVDGTPGSKTTSASATVNDVSLLNSSLLGIVLQSVVSLDATQIHRLRPLLAIVVLLSRQERPPLQEPMVFREIRHSSQFSAWTSSWSLHQWRTHRSSQSMHRLLDWLECRDRSMSF
ncbi:hypothetical protein KOR42_33860 [Thalassoglobus neptunius]|uniref:Choice-of-anchor G family protein n=1 Tax=Thalassoglobus neptunius TaxID=1938619 RepID=A0A5C5WM62_9PLAN|nr:hypothetical protein [Thalassoglobus neptunius]TWT51700.1 hypothetical protein KOR42_33860 [Thalassoglobus neptunius]